MSRIQTIFFGVFAALIFLGCVTVPSPLTEPSAVPVPVLEPTSEPTPTPTPEPEPAPAPAPIPEPRPTPDENNIFPRAEPLIEEREALPPGPVFIDDVYVWDLETNSQTRGRALVAGKTYEVIAENREPFSEYVRFTVLIDGEEGDSSEARCPDQCANENMYSLPLTIHEGNYREIQILAQDASGANGESVVYSYAVSEEEASYLAETCTVPSEVSDYPAVSGGDSAIFYAGTITEGWPHGAAVNPYNASGDFANLCDELNVISGAAGINNGFLAQTSCNILFGYRPDVVDTEIDPVACTCDCTVAAADIHTSSEITVTFPNWVDYDGGTQCEKDEWDRFIENAKVHEEGHVELCEQGRADIETRLQNAPSQTSPGATCQVACNAAVDRLEADMQHRFDEGFAQSEQEQDDYDRDTEHGQTQGAVLDCDAC